MHDDALIRRRDMFALRADFYGAFMTSSLWTDNDGRISRIDLGPPSSDSLRVGIERLARDLDVYVQPELVSRLLDDAAREPGALPLLQETLFQLWGKRTERLLALTDYQALSNGTRTGLAFAVGSMPSASLRMLFAQATRNLPVSPLLRHQGDVMSAAFSPDGTRVVTASKDKTARVWDAATGKPVTGPLEHQDLVVSAAFSPDGARVVTASDDKTARVWNAATGKPLTEPLQHQAAVRSAAFSRDGMRVVTASYDQTARVWDAATGKPLTGPLSIRGRW